jgi:hypothetical protein
MRIDDLLVEVRDPNLNRIGQIRPQDLVGATFVVRFNNVGSWSLTLPHNHPLGEFLRQPNYGLILTGPDGSTILSGPMLSARLSQTQDNIEGNWEITGASDDIIVSEHLAYPKPSTADVTAQTDDYDDRSGEAEFVIKSYLEANIGALAPSSRRVDGLTIADNQSRGEIVSAAARFDNLQNLIYQLAQVGGIGYQLIQVGTELLFEVFEPQDRTSTVRMDIENRKLSSAVLSYGTPTVTRAIVGGKGEGKNRTFIERTSSESLQAESSWGRRVETFVDGRSANNLNELNTAGDELLVERGKTITEMSVTPSDDVNMVYGVDWFLGDRVTVVNNNIETAAVVTEIGIRIDSDGVRLGATVGTPVGIEFEAKLLAKTNQLDSRVSNLERSTTGYGISTQYIPGGSTTGTQPVFDPAEVFTASFTRFGNLVHFSILVDFDTITSFGTGQYRLTLPYPSKNSYEFREGCLHDASASTQYGMAGHVTAGESTIWLSSMDKVGSAIQDVPFTYNSPITLTTADSFHISGTYEIEA